MNLNKHRLAILFLSYSFLLTAALSSLAAPRIRPGQPAPYTRTIQSSQLYTSPTGSGTIKGKLVGASSPTAIFAVSREKIKVTQTTKLLQGGARSEAKYRIAVYIADIADDDATFVIKGLQEGIYDLMVLLDDCYYDGIVLNRRSSKLTREDIQTITEKIKVSNPYFNEKAIARLAGGTGHSAKARALVQEVRSLPVTLQSAEVRSDIQTRSIKLFLMEDVAATGGNHWLVKETREIVRQEVGPPDSKGAIPEYFCKQLSNVFVVDAVEDLGDIRLTKDPPP